MRLLDLFCGAGMASDGYSAAGFTDIVGVDINQQPHYPYTFVMTDALDYLTSADLSSFDFIHASPPCQAFTRAAHLRTAQGGGVEVCGPTNPGARVSEWGHCALGC